LIGQVKLYFNRKYILISDPRELDIRSHFFQCRVVHHPRTYREPEFNSTVLGKFWSFCLRSGFNGWHLLSPLNDVLGCCHSCSLSEDLGSSTRQGIRCSNCVISHFLWNIFKSKESNSILVVLIAGITAQAEYENRMSSPLFLANSTSDIPDRRWALHNVLTSRDLEFPLVRHRFDHMVLRRN
jgi:hypothetical protein